MYFYTIAPLSKKDIQFSDVEIIDRLTESQFVKHTGDVAVWYDDGRIMACHLKEGVLHGPFVEFKPACGFSKPATKGYYEEGLPEGNWTFVKPLKEKDVLKAFGPDEDIDKAEVTVRVRFKKGKIASQPTMTLRVTKGTEFCQACEAVSKDYHLQCPELPRKLTAHRLINSSKGEHSRED